MTTPTCHICGKSILHGAPSRRILFTNPQHGDAHEKCVIAHQETILHRRQLASTTDRTGQPRQLTNRPGPVPAGRVTP